MRSDDEPPVVLVGGSRGYNSLSVARVFGRRGRTVNLLLEASDESLATRSRFVRATARADPNSSVFDAWTKWCIDVAPERSVVIPCADRGVEFVSRHRKQLEAAGLRPAPANDDVTLALLDKERCYELARLAGMATPRTARVTDVEQALAMGKTFELPFALKPRVSHEFAAHARGGRKAIVVRSHGDLERQVGWLVAEGLPMIMTEIIPGSEDSYCSYYTYLDVDGEPLAHFTKRKLRQYPVGFGEGSFHLTDWAPEVAETGLALLQALGVRGMVNVEFKRDERDGELKLIECNARLTAANELVRRSGIDFAEIIYRRAQGRPVSPATTYETGLGMWFPMHDLLAFRELRSAGHLTTRTWLASLRHPQIPAVLDLADLGPTVTKAGQLLRWGRHRVLPDRVQRASREVFDA